MAPMTGHAPTPVRHAIVAALSLATAVALGAPAQPVSARAAHPPAPAPGPIVAIGDSFTAGLGAGDYRIGANGCRQSQRSVARLLAIRSRRLLIDLSCPDARLASAPPGPLHLDHQIARVPSDAAFVVVGAGGNDLGFATVTGPCLIAGSSTCRTALEVAVMRLPQITRDLTRALLHVRRQAPRAHVIAVGYPALVRDTPMCTLWLGRERVRWILNAQDALESAIRTAAVRAGVRYADWPPTGRYRTLCDAEPWFVTGEATIIDEVLHPTYEAVRAMAQRLYARLPALAVTDSCERANTNMPRATGSEARRQRLGVQHCEVVGRTGDRNIGVPGRSSGFA